MTDQTVKVKSKKEGCLENEKILTTKSFPAFSGLLAILIAAAAAAPDDIPTCNACNHGNVTLVLIENLM